MKYVVCAAGESRILKENGFAESNIFVWKKLRILASGVLGGYTSTQRNFGHFFEKKVGQSLGEDARFYYRTFSIGAVDPQGAFDIEDYFTDTITHIFKDPSNSEISEKSVKIAENSNTKILV